MLAPRAQMRDHQPPGERSGHSRKLLHNRLIRKAVEPIPLDAEIVPAAWQGTSAGHVGAGAMKGCVEAGDLRDAAKPLGDRFDTRQAVGLVQGSQRGERIQPREHLGRDRHRLGVEAAAVDDAVADGGKRRLGLAAAQGVEQGRDRLLPAVAVSRWQQLTLRALLGGSDRQLCLAVAEVSLGPQRSSIAGVKGGLDAAGARVEHEHSRGSLTHRFTAAVAAA